MLGDIGKNSIIFIISHNMTWQDMKFTVFQYLITQCFSIFLIIWCNKTLLYINVSDDVRHTRMPFLFRLCNVTNDWRNNVTFTSFNIVMHKEYTLYYSMECKPITVSFQRSVLQHKWSMSHSYWPRIVWGCSMKNGGLVYRTFYTIRPDPCLNVSRQTDKMINNC